MASDERGNQKPKLPAGAVKLHKSMAVGDSLKEAEEKALTKEQVSTKPR